MKTHRLPLVLFVLLTLAVPFLLAFQQVLPVEVETIVVALVGLLIGKLGPYPMEAIFKLLGNVHGTLAVVITYFVGLLVGFLAVLASQAFLGYTPPGDFWGMAFVILLASQASFNRLRDSGKIASN